MKYVIQFTDKNNEVYLVRDSEARVLISGKQDALVSGTNIKTINGESILGSGNLVIGGGGSYTGGTGISISGSVINHSNSISAQATQALYPIAIDAQGHVTSYGSAVSNVSSFVNDAGYLTLATLPIYDGSVL